MSSETHKEKLPALRSLKCCCCGVQFVGRQWWNRDTGYGLGNCCIEFVSRNETPETMRSLYGERGIHYDLPDL